MVTSLSCHYYFLILISCMIICFILVFKFLSIHYIKGFKILYKFIKMSEEEIEKWAREGRSKELHMSPSWSSFEVLDPHDPIISRLATQLFKRTNDYLQGEMASGQDYYNMLEEMNRLTITKYADLRNLAVNLGKTLNEYNEIYNQQIKPLVNQIDHIDTQASQLEANAYRLDSYTKQLLAKFKQLKGK